MSRQGPRSILVVRPDGIGDEVLCLPVASELRRLLPGARLAFLSSWYAAPALERHPDLDEVLTLRGGERVAELVALFRPFEAAIFLKPFGRLIWAAFQARVPLRVATGYRWYSFLVNRRVFEHRHDFSRHESEYNLGLLRGLGLEPGPVRPPQLVLAAAEREWAQQRLAGLPGRRVVVHPGGLSTRRWPPGRFRELAERLAAEGWGAVLTGSAAEAERFRAEAGGLGDAAGAILDLMGRLDLRQLMAVIGASTVVVSGSTGPAHLAAGLGVPTVTIYDPRRSSEPVRWRPLGPGVVLVPGVPTCEKCSQAACPHWDCLERIEPAQVAGHVGAVAAGAGGAATVRI